MKVPLQRGGRGTRARQAGDNGHGLPGPAGLPGPPFRCHLAAGATAPGSRLPAGPWAGASGCARSEAQATTEVLVEC